MSPDTAVFPGLGYSGSKRPRSMRIRYVQEYVTGSVPNCNPQNLGLPTVSPDGSSVTPMQT